MKRRYVLGLTGGAFLGAGCVAGPGRPDDSTVTAGRSVGDADWPTIQADAANTAHHPGTTGPAKPPDTRWTFDASGDVSPTAVHDGTVYVTTTDGDVHAIDEREGGENWQSEEQLSSLGAPTIADGLVYVIEEGHRLLALAADSGTTQWSVPMEEGKDLTRVPAPTIVDGTVYLQATDLRTYAVDAGTGDVRWRVRTRNSFPRTPAVANDSVFVVFHERRTVPKLSTLAVADGAERWQFDIRVPDREVSVRTRPTVQGDLLFVGIRAANPDVTHTASGRVYAIDTRAGTEEWRVDTERPVRELAVDGETVYATTISAGHTQEGTIHAFDATDGSESWTVDGGEFGFHSPVIVDETLYAIRSTAPPAERETLIALDVAEGAERWSKRVDFERVGGLTVVNDTAYLSVQGAVYAVA